jgi:hypothetical protein
MAWCIAFIISPRIPMVSPSSKRTHWAGLNLHPAAPVPVPPSQELSQHSSRHSCSTGSGRSTGRWRGRGLKCGVCDKVREPTIRLNCATAACHEQTVPCARGGRISFATRFHQQRQFRTSASGFFRSFCSPEPSGRRYGTSTSEREIHRSILEDLRLLFFQDRCQSREGLVAESRYSWSEDDAAASSRRGGPWRGSCVIRTRLGADIGRSAGTRRS